MRQIQNKIKIWTLCLKFRLRSLFDYWTFCKEPNLSDIWGSRCTCWGNDRLDVSRQLRFGYKRPNRDIKTLLAYSKGYLIPRQQWAFDLTQLPFKRYSTTITSAIDWPANVLALMTKQSPLSLKIQQLLHIDRETQQVNFQLSPIFLMFNLWQVITRPVAAVFPLCQVQLALCSSHSPGALPQPWGEEQVAGVRRLELPHHHKPVHTKTLAHK